MIMIKKYLRITNKSKDDRVGLMWDIPGQETGLGGRILQLVQSGSIDRVCGGEMLFDAWGQFLYFAYNQEQTFENRFYLHHLTIFRVGGIRFEHKLFPLQAGSIFTHSLMILKRMSFSRSNCRLSSTLLGIRAPLRSTR